MITGVDLVECNLTREEEQVRRTLNSQEAKVILLMREMAYQTITVKIENGKVIHKEQHRSIKD
jgi:hypothetical protein